MKKIILILIALFITSNAYATISTTRFVSPDDISVSAIDGNFVTLTNAANSLDGTLIQTGTISSDSLDANANPVNSRNEGLGDFVYTGLLAPTSASLVSTTTAGTAYIEGWRVVKAATPKTYTASKDTYVDLSSNGTFTYSEVALGGTAPSVASNSIRLFKAVTSGTAITSVTDLRQTTPPILRVYDDLKLGCVVSRDITTTTKVSVDVGTIEFGTSATSGNRRNVAPVYIDTTTTGRNALDTGTLALGYYGVWAYPDPDNSNNFECLASTSFASPGTVADVDNERLIGWFYASSTTEISPDSIGAYNGVGGDAPNAIDLECTIAYALNSVAFTDLPGSDDVRFYSSGRPAYIAFDAAIERIAHDETVWCIIEIDSVEYPKSTRSAGILTDFTRNELSTQMITNLNKGPHTIAIKVKNLANPVNILSRDVVIIEQ